MHSLVSFYRISDCHSLYEHQLCCSQSQTLHHLFGSESSYSNCKRVNVNGKNNSAITKGSTVCEKLLKYFRNGTFLEHAGPYRSPKWRCADSWKESQQLATAFFALFMCNTNTTKGKSTTFNVPSLLLLCTLNMLLPTVDISLFNISLMPPSCYHTEPTWIKIFILP